MSKILLIDDEQDILDLLTYNLAREGFSIITAKDGTTAWELALNSDPDLIILDLMLPGISGLELCQKFRNNQKTSDIPVIMLTAKGDEFDKVLGLEIGADDYVTKPFSIREIVARVKSQLRRSISAPKVKENYQFGTLHVDLSTHEVKISESSIKLSPLEFNLLKFFITHPERVYSRDDLLDKVWGDDAYVEPRTVDVHIRRLREKIEPVGAMIKTIRGVGYRFSPINEDSF